MSRRWILVTGGAGFIGSNIVAELCARDDYDIAVCDRLRTAESGKWRNIAKQPIADFVAPEAMFAWLDARRGQVEAVVHMGAISSTTEPDADLIIHNNFSLSKALWAWCADHGTRLIYASSAATYGDGALGFDDADDEASLKALRPLNAYGWSKALFDIHARRSADRGYAPPQWAGLKFFNVYGPNEYHKGSMRSVVHQVWPAASKGETVSLFRSHRPDYADGGQLRDFVYVRDCASVAVWLINSPHVNGIFNLGTGQARSFNDLVTSVFDVCGRKASLRYIDTPLVIREKYQYFTQARMDRLIAAGYEQPLTPLEDGIADYVRRYLMMEEKFR